MFSITKKTCVRLALMCYLTSSAFASYEGDVRHSPINKTVTWTPCQEYNGFDCGTFDSPLDYADPKQGKALIAVIRFNATRERRGSIFINPGKLVATIMASRCANTATM